MTTIRSKADVQFHTEGYAGDGVPAVNVKIYDGLERGFLDAKNYVETFTGEGEPWDKAFTLDWCNENLSDEDHSNVWDWAIENSWEQLQNDVEAEDVFPGYDAKVYSEGRSGGWAIVHGIPDFETWDAVMLARWRKFARFARETANDVPYRMVSDIYENIFIPRQEQARKDAAVAYARTDLTVLGGNDGSR